jgi:hypothetical protein
MSCTSQSMADAFAKQTEVTGRERRDARSREDLLHQIASEFGEMRGMALSPAQASRLFGLDDERRDRVFDELVERGVLDRTEDGHYVRKG